MSLINDIKDLDSRLVQKLPSIERAQKFGDDLIDFLFPVRAKNRGASVLIDLQYEMLQKEFIALVAPISEQYNLEEASLSKGFFEELQYVFNSLKKDAESILEFDPAAYSLEEVISAYPGFYAVAIYRISHVLYTLKVPLLPRILSEAAHSKTGIDIHPGATIGSEFFIDHGTGIVIGETSEIGNGVKIYQGVTLGALQVAKSESNKKRHPTIEDNVTIYSGATILGGETVIGHDSVIGGNVWLTSSVVPFSLVFATHAVKVRNAKNFNEPLNFVI
jgi:serine O-acetyltransferase